MYYVACMHPYGSCNNVWKHTMHVFGLNGLFVDLGWWRNCNWSQLLWSLRDTTKCWWLCTKAKRKQYKNLYILLHILVCVVDLNIKEIYFKNFIYRFLFTLRKKNKTQNKKLGHFQLKVLVLSFQKQLEE